MNFAEIQNEVIDIRFKESQRASVKHWINLRYQAIWAYADWPWKRQGPTPLSLQVGDASPALPSDFLRPIRIYDDLGNELTWLEAAEFDGDHRYPIVNEISARPSSFKWVNDVITVGLTPDADYDFSLVYERKTAYMANGTTPTSGLMTNTNDEPIWDDHYHYILVVGAIASGLRLENDPTFPSLEDEYSGLLNSMQDYYLPTASPAGHLQYGSEYL